MNKLNNPFPIICIFLALSLGIHSCNESKKDKTDIKIDSIIKIDTSFTDTIGNKYTADANYFEVSRELNLAKDSIELLKNNISSLSVEVIKAQQIRDSTLRANIITIEKLGVAEYKLLRIREYNRIAAQGNNIKYLRSWINRVINK